MFCCNTSKMYHDIVGRIVLTCIRVDANIIDVGLRLYGREHLAL